MTETRKRDRHSQTEVQGGEETTKDTANKKQQTSEDAVQELVLASFAEH